MKLTKFAHATVMLERDGHHILIDPGSFTSHPAELFARADAVLYTHEHGDHYDRATLLAARELRPELPVFAPAAITQTLPPSANIRAVAAGSTFSVGSIPVAVFGDHHAVIHPDIPVISNVGYLVDGTVFHPGDAYLVPGVPVSTLLVPTSGPWTKLGDAVDYIRAVAPERALQIHDLLLSERGLSMSENLLGGALTGVPLTTLPIGATLEL